jgi:hypothetical protein
MSWSLPEFKSQGVCILFYFITFFFAQEQAIAVHEMTEYLRSVLSLRPPAHIPPASPSNTEKMLNKKLAPPDPSSFSPPDTTIPPFHKRLYRWLRHAHPVGVAFL